MYLDNTGIKHIPPKLGVPQILGVDTPKIRGTFYKIVEFDKT